MNSPSYLSGALFMKAYRLLRANVTGCLNEFDINPTSWVMLGIIREARDGIRLIEVADTMNVKAPLVTTLVQDLVAKNLIELFPHGSDKRVKLLMVTQNGKQFIKKVETSMDLSLRKVLQGVHAEELAAFKTVLEAIVSNSNED